MKEFIPLMPINRKKLISSYILMFMLILLTDRPPVWRILFEVFN
jgi:hypothetical protein